jgi:hypothetical protein
MAHIITINTILDDSLNTIFKVDIVSDGSPLSNYVIYDPALHFNKGNLVKLMRISYELNDFEARLAWAGTQITPAITLAPAHHEDICYDWIGGLRNDLNPAVVPDGRLTMTLFDHGAAESGHMIIHLKHRN